ncbi:MAG TPA: recombinase family protein, partial [Lacipirellulaceae bacterium]|nr:recombinase family protein [Lacipirellulaceae bacterium]
MRIVIYCRFSSELQNPKSLVDQEREIRAGLARLGIDASNAEVITDAAVSGTRTDRDGFDRIDKRIKNGEAFLLAVDDQSRFTRLANALSLITDLVFAGGRFISVCEQIDTKVEGWRLKVRVMELHHGACSDETANRVRRGQRGRVIDGKSAGDFGYGYESFAIDLEYAKRYCGRGPKPVMGLRINRRQARIINWIFQQFADGKSINWIARELTRRKVPRDRRARSPIWFAPTIRAMLSNAKFIGLWIWGITTTVRDSEGRKKQVSVEESEHVVSERPELRIVSQELWDRVQSRLADLRQKTGYKAGEDNRAPILHYTITNPTDVLMTLLRCGYCGAKMHHAGSKGHVYRECANGADGREACIEKARVPAAKAKTVLLEFIASLLKNMPLWVTAAVDEMRRAIHEFHERVPAELEELRSQLREAEQRRDNLMRIAESGGVDDVEDFKHRL